MKSIPAFEPWAKVAGGRMIGHAGDVQVRAALPSVWVSVIYV